MSFLEIKVSFKLPPIIEEQKKVVFFMNTELFHENAAFFEV